MLDSAGASRMTTVKYYDGLGRLEQTVAVGASPSGADLVMHSSRDRAGRIVQQFCATPSAGGGAYVDGARVHALAAETYADANPYALTEYEQSPLSRQVAVTGAGQAWHSEGKSTRTAYLTNSATAGAQRCRLFSASDTRSITDTVVTVTANGFYPAGELLVTRTEDEDGRVSLVFTDKQGRTVLTRSLTDGRHADTYYVYDIAGNLTAVFPPAFSAKVGSGKISSTSTDARDFAYFYIYDWFGRCRAKKLPGRDWQITAYDRAGKALITQDGNMRKRGEAVFTLSDAFGRECVTGVAKQMLSVADANMDVSVLARRSVATDSLGGYEIMNNAITLPSDNLLSATYYDDYSFLDGKAFGKELAYRDAAGYDRRYECADYPALSAKGLLTGTATRILGDSAMLYKSVYYDYHGNVIQSHEQNAMGGYDHYYYRLSFTGKPLEIKRVHGAAGTINEDIVRYTYDSMERLLTISHSHDGASPVTLASNTYDAIGRLTACAVNGGGSVTRYAYNVRGWTRGVTNPHFSQQLHYQDAPQGGTPCWGGGISGITWRQRESLKAAHATESVYCFSYDGLNRLTGAKYSATGEEWNGDLVTQGERNFSCAYSYDLNGNMLSLKRHGVTDYITSLPTHVRAYGIIDDLKMAYDGNQLTRVTDAAEDLTYAGAMDFRDEADGAEEYTYDANGNMTSDLNRGIVGITYNTLNLPQRILFKDGHENRYTYAADGRKLRVEYRLNNFQVIDKSDASGIDWAEQSTIGDGMVVEPGVSDSVKADNPYYTTLTVRDYCGSYIYKNGKLERVLTAGGYIEDGEYYFYIKDYQGNVRVVLDQRNHPVELNAYYPYGMLMAATPSDSKQPHKYGAKELDRENALDLYDSQARWYAPQTGRTPTMDPLAEKYPHLSPYLWCAANPNRYRDPDGRKVELYATSLPGCDIPLATHTFIVIRDKNNNVREYFAFGSEYDGIKGSYSGRLKQATYRQDQMVINGNDTEHLKKIIEISPPSGMSESDFDNVVAGVAKSFGNNSGITYFLAPSTADMTKGNCNTSTSTILLKSGVSKERIKSIAKEIPGISYGFSTSARPWTEHEQAEAVKSKQQADYLYNVVGKP